MDKQTLCLCYLMGEATAEQTAELSQWIAESPKNAEAFALLAAQDAHMTTAVSQLCQPEDDSLSLLEELAELERLSEPGQLVDVTETVLEQQRLKKERMRFEAASNSERADQAKSNKQLIVVIPKALVWLGLAAAVVLAATLLFYVTPQSDGPADTASNSGPTAVAPNTGPAFATLVRGLDVQWASVEDESGLLREGKHQLLAGMAELELLSGTRVVIEGPASFELTGINMMDVTQGRVVASVPQSSAGFILNTPNARFVETAGRINRDVQLSLSTHTPTTSVSLYLTGNLTINASADANATHSYAKARLVSSQRTTAGTEFGVRVDQDQQTLVQVFHGTIKASPIVDLKPVGEPLSIGESGAAVIASGGNELTFVYYDDKAFTRELTVSLSLADMIMGGDGTTSRQNIGLHTQTGQYTSKITENNALVGLVSSGRANLVQGSPYVSRVFIPSKDGRIEDLPTGLSLPNMPQTTGIGYGLIWSGAEMPPVEALNPVSIPTNLPGYDFVAAGKQALVMHSNSGLVVDLDAIRKMNPGFEIIKVQAIVGNASGAGKPNAPTTLLSEFLAYVDSETVMHRTFDLTDPDKLLVDRLDLTINETNRYLTVVSTDGGDTRHMDWIILGDPIVILKPLELLNPNF
ncbi:MAG: hypothetical protein AB8C95_00325 [Phycisphaeraceae bacterium]